MEKRKYSRVLFRAEANVQCGENTISGTVDNLSMKGIFLNTTVSIPNDFPLDISIVLSGSSTVLSIFIKGRAVRHTDSGIAIEFSEMDLDSFIHLKNVVTYNSDDPDGISEEYYRSIHSK